MLQNHRNISKQVCTFFFFFLACSLLTICILLSGPWAVLSWAALYTQWKLMIVKLGTLGTTSVSKWPLFTSATALCLYPSLVCSPCRNKVWRKTLLRCVAGRHLCCSNGLWFLRELHRSVVYQSLFWFSLEFSNNNIRWKGWWKGSNTFSSSLNSPRLFEFTWQFLSV